MPVNSGCSIIIMINRCYIYITIVIKIFSNILLSSIVIKPLIRLAATADAISLGKLEQSFQVNSQDEIGFLADSFKKMQVSLRIAMKRISRNAELAKAQPVLKSTFSQELITSFVRQINNEGKLPSLKSIFKIASKANTIPDDLVAAAWQEWNK